MRADRRGELDADIRARRRSPRLTRPTLVVVTTLVAALGIPPAALASSDVTNVGNTLTVVGDDGVNDLALSYDSGQERYVVTDTSGATAGSGCVQDGSDTVECSVSPEVRYFTDVWALGGDDTIKIGYGDPSAWPSEGLNVVSAGPGDDVIGGSESLDDLRGGEGDDQIDGGGDSDTLTGGEPFITGAAGTDTLFGGPGSDNLSDGDVDNGGGPLPPDAVDGDTIDGGVCTLSFCPTGVSEGTDDVDSIDFGARVEDLDIDLTGGGSPQGQASPPEDNTIARVESVVGGSGNDQIRGGDTNNSLYGSSGNDVLLGRGGDDYLDGGEGGDQLDGEAGEDVLDGGSVEEDTEVFVSDGRDVLDGGPDRDTAAYTRRTEQVVVNLAQLDGQGAPGENDRLANFENVAGGEGPDVLTGNSLANTISGFFGDDQIHVDQQDGVPDTADCGEGNDTATKDAEDSAVGCETVNPTTGGGGSGGGGGGGAGGGGAGGGSGGTITIKALPGRKSLGRKRVSKRGVAKLFGYACTPPSGPRCTWRTSGRTTATAGVARTIKIGKGQGTIKAGKTGAIKVKLTKSSLKLLKHRKALKARVTVRIKRGTKSVKKTYKVTFRAP